MQYGVHPFRQECCGTCKHFSHTGHCDKPINKRGDALHSWTPMNYSPCKDWIKGYVFESGFRRPQTPNPQGAGE